jgi:hypothetical protein
VGELVTHERAYVLAAYRVPNGRKHIVDGALNANGSFRTLCGTWGNKKEMPWTVGEMRCDASGWCRRCQRSEASEAGRG